MLKVRNYLIIKIQRTFIFYRHSHFTNYIFFSINLHNLHTWFILVTVINILLTRVGISEVFFIYFLFINFKYGQLKIE